MTTITTSMVKEIRRRFTDGETAGAIAADLGIHKTTVYRYASERIMQSTAAAGRRYRDRLKADPVRHQQERERTRDAHRARRAENNI